MVSAKMVESVTRLIEVLTKNPVSIFIIAIVAVGVFGYEMMRPVRDLTTEVKKLSKEVPKLTTAVTLNSANIEIVQQNLSSSLGNFQQTQNNRAPLLRRMAKELNINLEEYPDIQPPVVFKPITIAKPPQKVEQS
jgi:hypothetical protein